LQNDKLYVVGLSNDLSLLEFSKKRVRRSEYFVKLGLDPALAGFDAKKTRIFTNKHEFSQAINKA
jgi:hypothetical protein